MSIDTFDIKYLHVLSPDTETWNYILSEGVAHRNLENQVEMVLAYPSSYKEDDLENEIEEYLEGKFNSDNLTIEISKVDVTEDNAYEYNFDWSGEYRVFAITISGYNWLGLPDLFEL